MGYQKTPSAVVSEHAMSVTKRDRRMIRLMAIPNRTYPTHKLTTEAPRRPRRAREPSRYAREGGRANSLAGDCYGRWQSPRGDH
jgi:hypothetical protein